MSDYLEFCLDKFVFKVALDRLYSEEGVWVKLEDPYVRIGISDYLQQRSGDVAFAEAKPEGTTLALGEEIAVIETIKVNISLTAPVTGRVIEVTPALSTSPEAINLDPDGAGWLVVIEATEWDSNLKQLMTPQAYFVKIKQEAEEEVKKE